MSFVPSILLEGGGESIIVPLKIDITHAGTRIGTTDCTPTAFVSMKYDY